MQTNFISGLSNSNPTRTDQKMLQAASAQQSEPFDLSNFRSSLHPKKAITCILISLTVVCVCVIAIACLVVVREYAMSQVYRKSKCSFLNITNSDEDEECQYCPGVVYKSEGKTEACTNIPFPCVQIWVSFVDINEVIIQNKILYSDANQATGSLNRCSYSIDYCLKTKELNSQAIKDYTSQIILNRNSTFTCYYDTETVDNAILQKLYSKWDVFHCLFWPGFVMVICAVIFLYLECHRQGMVVCPCFAAFPSAENNSHPVNDCDGRTDNHGHGNIDGNINTSTHGKVDTHGKNDTNLQGHGKG